MSFLSHGLGTTSCKGYDDKVLRAEMQSLE